MQRKFMRLLTKFFENWLKDDIYRMQRWITHNVHKIANELVAKTTNELITKTANDLAAKTANELVAKETNT